MFLLRSLLNSSKSIIEGWDCIVAYTKRNCKSVGFILKYSFIIKKKRGGRRRKSFLCLPSVQVPIWFVFHILSSFSSRLRAKKSIFHSVYVFFISSCAPFLRFLFFFYSSSSKVMFCGYLLSFQFNSWTNIVQSNKKKSSGKSFKRKFNLIFPCKNDEYVFLVCFLIFSFCFFVCERTLASLDSTLWCVRLLFLLLLLLLLFSSLTALVTSRSTLTAVILHERLLAVLLGLTCGTRTALLLAVDVAVLALAFDALLFTYGKFVGQKSVIKLRELIAYHVRRWLDATLVHLDDNPSGICSRQSP